MKHPNRTHCAPTRKQEAVRFAWGCLMASDTRGSDCDQYRLSEEEAMELVGTGDHTHGDDSWHDAIKGAANG